MPPPPPWPRGSDEVLSTDEGVFDPKAAASSPSSDPSSVVSARERLLMAVSGTDRGARAGPEERLAVDAAVDALVAAGDAESTTLRFPEDLERISGKWRLVYTSAFSASFGTQGAGEQNNRGSRGGRAPDPLGGPAGQGSPVQLGAVYQRIRLAGGDVATRAVDNIVEVKGRVVPWPLPQVGPSLNGSVTLEHSFKEEGGARLRIALRKVTLRAKGTGLPFVRPLELPEVPNFLSDAGAGSFDTVFCDGIVRVTRGVEFGETRVFVRT